MNEDENFKLLLSNIPMWKRVFIKNWNIAVCVSVKKHIYLLFSKICHKNEVFFIAVTQWSIL